MRLDVVCDCGQVIRLDRAPLSATLKCPACGGRVDMAAHLAPNPSASETADPSAPHSEPQPQLTGLKKLMSRGTPPATETPTEDAPAGRAKGLWNLMRGGAATGTEQSPVEPETVNIDEQASPAASPASPVQENLGRQQHSSTEDATEKAASGQKGLWVLMGTAGGIGDAGRAVDAAPTAPVESSVVPKAKSRSLWDVMSHQDEVVASAEEPAAVLHLGGRQPSITAEQATLPGSSSGSVRQMESPAAATPVRAHVAEVSPVRGAPQPVGTPQPASVPPVAGASAVRGVSTAVPATGPALKLETDALSSKVTPIAPGLNRRAVMASALGTLSLPVASLGLVSQFWSQLPVTLFGLTGLLLGFLGSQEIRKSSGRQTGQPLAITGIVLSIVGMLLGPLVFADLGQKWRSENSRNFSESHLKQIGAGLLDHHQAKGTFPPAATLRRGVEQGDVKLHGWMTALLPYLGEQELHGRIDLLQPFNADVNLPHMRQEIPAFLAAGASREKIAGRFAPAHFAGVGGELQEANGGVSQLGIFGPNLTVTQDDVQDGLSQTLAVGEIAAKFPPWGEPDNFRSLTKGLNRDPLEFGNQLRNGASFLMGDGSVRFFSNQTDFRILRALSTRNGEDKIAEK